MHRVHTFTSKVVEFEVGVVFLLFHSLFPNANANTKANTNPDAYTNADTYDHTLTHTHTHTHAGSNADHDPDTNPTQSLAPSPTLTSVPAECVSPRRWLELAGSPLGAGGRWTA